MRDIFRMFRSLTLLALIWPLNLMAQSGAMTDVAAVQATIDRFHTALEAGDGDGALDLLNADAIVLESGDSETRGEYRAAHLAADIEFSRSLRPTRTPLQITVLGDVAWATAHSEANGRFKGREIRSRGAELMVLSREPAGWRIRAIHWSARNR